MIWLLRHGDAEDSASEDSARRLSAKGVEQSRTAGRALLALGIELDACISSPKLRALQTAQLAAEPLGIEVEVSEALRGGDFDPAALADGHGETLLVGHEPDFSRAIQLASGAMVELKKGGLAGLCGSTLCALLRPAQLRLIAERS